MINVSYVSLLCLAEGYEYFEMPVISRWPSKAPYELFLVVRRASTLESGVHLFPEYILTYRCLLMSINSLQVAWASMQWEEGHRARPTQPRDHSLRRAVPRRESSSIRASKFNLLRCCFSSIWNIVSDRADAARLRSNSQCRPRGEEEEDKRCGDVRSLRRCGT